MNDKATSTGGMRADDRPTPGVFPPPESMRPTLVGTRYMISAGHPLAAHAAAEIMEAGGTAIDAGIAAGFACNVVHADMCNLGGIAPIVLQGAGEAPFAISGVGTWGASATLEAFLERHGNDIPLGLAGGIVPAACSAWLTALSRFGTLSLEQVAAPALAFAADGFAVDVRTADSYRILGEGLADWPSSLDVYWPNGRPPRPGDVLRQPALARTIERLVEAGRGLGREAAIAAAHDLFYRGEIAQRIASWSREFDGWLSASDLAEFTVTVEPAPQVGYRGWHVATTPGYTQGPAMLLALRILEAFDLPGRNPLAADTLHLVAEALTLAFAERERAMCDPEFAEVSLDEVLSDANVAALAKRIDMARAQDDLHPRVQAVARPKADTTYLCVVDADGNLFSATPSDTIDGGPVIPELGIIVSPRGVQSSITPGHPNRIGPGRRPRVTPAPALATHQDGRGIAFGCPGGDVIIQGMLQAFLNLSDFGMTYQQAVESPRVAVFGFPSSFFPNPHFPRRLDVEARIPAAVRAELARKGRDIHEWPDWEFDAGGVAIVGDLVPPTPEQRVLAAGADPRRVTYAWGR